MSRYHLHLVRHWPCASGKWLLDPQGWPGKRSPPGESALSWVVFFPLPFITSASGRLSLLSWSSSELIGSMSALEIGFWNADGRRWHGHSMSGIGGILLYIFTSCCDKIARHVSTFQFKASTEEYRYVYIHVLELGGVHLQNIWHGFSAHECLAYSQNGIRFLNGVCRKSRRV
jgi:hypothetical protein